ncbi:unnamed protein product, partial [marine sediment metagenome]
SDNVDLVEVNSLYVLDFDTETREVGKYALFVTLQKDNYAPRMAFIDLEIKNRTILTLEPGGDYIKSENYDSESGQYKAVKGEDIVITIELWDKSNPDGIGGYLPLLNADVKLYIEGNDENFDEDGNGEYTLTLSTKDYDAFFRDLTLTAEIRISKENYDIDPIGITIVVKMSEIFGFPMFYFIMIISAIAAVGVSLVTYRQVQRRKIPKFVRKVREMQKNIKGGQSIPDSLLYPSKEEYMVKLFGD